MYPQEEHKAGHQHQGQLEAVEGRAVGLLPGEAGEADHALSCVQSPELIPLLEPGHIVDCDSTAPLDSVYCSKDGL